MKQIVQTWSVLAMTFIGLSAFVMPPALPTGVRTVVIDAGHGGKDNGTGEGREKRFALDMALRLGQKIQTELPQVNVIYTRTTDVFVPLNERAEIANRAKADLFISIHCNASPSSHTAYGTETYVMGLHKTEENLDLAKRENNVVLLEEDYLKTYKGFNPKSPLAHIVLANYQNGFMKQSLHFASLVEQEMKQTARQRSRGVKQAGFLVIWRTTMPSVLIETGYLTNARDSEHLASEEGRENIALAIFEAFKKYKKSIEG